MFMSMAQRFRRYRSSRQTERELRSLPDHILRDIGFSRSELVDWMAAEGMEIPPARTLRRM